MKTFFITYIFFFTTLILNAQDSPYPNWLWAKSGGSTSELSGASESDDKGYERIVDLAIDSDNNYYFVAEVGGGLNFSTMEWSLIPTMIIPIKKICFCFRPIAKGITDGVRR